MDLIVTADSPDARQGWAAQGWASLGTQRFRCALGRGGIIADKREGDGGTPVGAFPLRRLLVRTDKGPIPKTQLPIHLYDLVLVIGHNDDPVVKGMGSAVFVHLAHDDYRPTEGCIAFARADMEKILAAMGPGDRVVVERP